MSDSDAIKQMMIARSAQRIAEADAAEYRSLMAFRSGRFEEYWLARGREAEERVEAENERLKREYEPEGGDSGADGGDGAGGSVPEDDRDSPPEPREEELPPSTGA